MIEFERISNQTDRYNFHSHTQFCDGRDSMESILLSAVDAGMKYFGFSPHSPLSINSPCNMAKDSVAEYLSELKRLKENYKGAIDVFAGMEIDYLSEEEGPGSSYFQRLPLDYRIGSVHFVKNQNGEPIDCDGNSERFKINLIEKFDNDLPFVVENYLISVIKMIEKGGFDILGHADKISLNASSVNPEIVKKSWYKTLVEEIIEKSAKTGLIMEINTKAFESKGRFFPDESWWPLIRHYKIPLLINSDVHYSAKVDSGRKEALKRLKAL